MAVTLVNRPLIFSFSSSSSEEKKEESKKPADDNVERVGVVVSASFDANEATEWDTDKSQAKRTLTNELKGRCCRADLPSDTESCDPEAFEKRIQILMKMREPWVIKKTNSV